MSNQLASASLFQKLDTLFDEEPSIYDHALHMAQLDEIEDQIDEQAKDLIFPSHFLSLILQKQHTLDSSPIDASSSFKVVHFLCFAILYLIFVLLFLVMILVTIISWRTWVLFSLEIPCIIFLLLQVANLLVIASMLREQMRTWQNSLLLFVCQVLYTYVLLNVIGFVFVVPVWGMHMALFTAFPHVSSIWLYICSIAIACVIVSIELMFCLLPMTCDAVQFDLVPKRPYHVVQADVEETENVASTQIEMEEQNTAITEEEDAIK